MALGVLVNLPLALYLALRSIDGHRTVALATVLGVAIGMGVVSAILIVDKNSSENRIQARFEATTEVLAPGQARARLMVHFERGEERIEELRRLPIPTQESEAAGGLDSELPAKRRGEADYQAMRLAVRLASMLAFAMGAVIVFYTMRFSVSARARELALLMCLGESRRNAAMSLLIEAGILGLAGTLLGLLLAFPTALWLITQGISTTGRVPSSVFLVPWGELAGLAALSLVIAIIGVIAPIHTLFRLRVAEVLAPRFMSPQLDARDLESRGFAWLAPPLMIAFWMAFRPFLRDWLSVVQFFLVEMIVAALLALAVLWWVGPVLRGLVHAGEWLLRPLLPLDAMLVGRRLKLTRRRLLFTIVGVALVFSLLTALHDITRSLQAEVFGWAQQTLYPYLFLRQRSAPDASELEPMMERLEEQQVYAFRLSPKVDGELPIRLINAADANRWLKNFGAPLLGPGKVMLTPTLAARFDVIKGDRVLIQAGETLHRFEIIDLASDIGFFTDQGQYVDLKSWMLFSDGNPLFAGKLEDSIGAYLTLRRADGRPPSYRDLGALRPYYRSVRQGARVGDWQYREIDRDFLIFDFILATTVLLAAVGVANGLLIQVMGRRREISVLVSLGVSRAQSIRLLLVEGVLLGLVCALVAAVLGNVLGAISIAFLDRFTLFDYAFWFSWPATFAISVLTLATCCLAALYPALVAARVAPSESLHYE